MHGLLHAEDDVVTTQDKGKGRAVEVEEGVNEDNVPENPAHELKPKAIYEFTRDGDRIEPRLRLWLAASEPTEGGDKHVRSVDGSDESHLEDVAETGSRIAVFLDSPDRQGTPVDRDGDSREDSVEVEPKDVVLLSEPLAQKPNESLVWTLQRKVSETAEDGESSPSQASDGWDVMSNGGSVSSLPVALANKEYVFLPFIVARLLMLCIVQYANIGRWDPGTCHSTCVRHCLLPITLHGPRVLGQTPCRRTVKVHSESGRFSSNNFTNCSSKVGYFTNI